MKSGRDLIQNRTCCWSELQAHRGNLRRAASYITARERREQQIVILTLRRGRSSYWCCWWSLADLSSLPSIIRDMFNFSRLAPSDLVLVFRCCFDAWNSDLLLINLPFDTIRWWFVSKSFRKSRRTFVKSKRFKNSMVWWMEESEPDCDLIFSRARMNSKRGSGCYKVQISCDYGKMLWLLIGRRIWGWRRDDALGIVR